MKIPADAIIAPEKLTRYLLVPQRRSDKSAFLARLGFTLNNPQVLDDAIRAQAAAGDAQVDEIDIYGEHMIVIGDLVGPTGSRRVITVWVLSAADNRVRFVTLKPLEKL